jgi:anti-sigma regulatory factor (Ser/Thr protein kinase)
MRQITLTIESDIENLSLVAVAVHRICESLGADDEEAGHIELCTTEAVANCIHHAYKNAPDRPVSVKIRASEHEIECDVCDDGVPMPAANVKALTCRPDDHEAFDEKNLLLHEHGRGLKIIASLMDETAYLSEGTENCLRMKKRIHG